ncbi:hypothetical protein FJZ28_01985 [Candidatus Peregrinibacteria bacterium]|nr:hypothetical protein [Candidatus Peregrinibacteria bacterium]
MTTLKNSGSACGKIILTGEYAVVFGYPGIAIPSPLQMTVEFADHDDAIVWDVPRGWKDYALDILHRTGAAGTLTMTSDIPLGKGMGASTALVIAICRAVLGPDCYEQALAIENIVNPGNSGIDFAVIWNERPLLFRKGQEPREITLHQSLRSLGFSLVDTGAPDQQTPELVAWVTERKDDLQSALEDIGNCTERLLAGEDVLTVIRDHNQAQQKLGVVTDKAKKLITKIEQQGGAAKVIGAGGRTGGSGIVMAMCNRKRVETILHDERMQLIGW